MKKVLLLVIVLIFSNAYAGRMKVSLRKFVNQRISVDKDIDITKIQVRLSCIWKPSIIQDALERKVESNTRYIDVDLEDITNSYKKKTFLITTFEDLYIDEYRLNRKLNCYTDFKIRLKSDFDYYRDVYILKIPLGKKGDLSNRLAQLLNSKVFTPEIFMDFQFRTNIIKLFLK